MQVNETWIGKQQLCASERVGWAGILAQRVGDVAALEPRPVDRIGRVLAAVRIDDLEPFASDRFGIASRRRKDVVRNDAWRDGPGGIENDVADRGTQ